MSAQTPQNTPQKNFFVTSSYNTALTPKAETLKPSFDYQKPKFDSEVENLANDLLNGMPVSEVQSQYVNGVTLWLRNYKKKILQKPDYQLAKKIDEITANLKMSNGASQYNQYQKEKIMDMENKLNQATVNLEKAKNRKQKMLENIENERADAVQKMKEQQAKEIEDLDEKYQNDMPARFRKYSVDLVNMKIQEKHMRDSGMYDEAQELHDEIAAVERYELEVKKLEYNKEWSTKREALIDHHNQQLEILNERYDLKVNTLAPEYDKKIVYFERIISNLEKQINNQRYLQSQAEMATTAAMTKRNINHLPPLGTKSNQMNRSSALARIMTVSGARTYTRAGKRRPASNAY